MHSLPDPGRRRWLALAAAAAASPLRAADADGDALARIRARGSLVVGLYSDMPPFHVDGKGIDVDVARALATRLGVGLTLLPFAAGETMDDDLRNMVWRGHYLGWGPADVLLHVPVEPALMAANPKVRIVAPYYRERVAIAWRRDALAAVPALGALRGQRVAVAGRSLAGWLLIGADDGALRPTLATGHPDGTAAAAALRAGAAVAAAGLASELQSVLARDVRFAIEPLSAARAPRAGWTIGCALKKDAGDLAAALEEAMQSVKLGAIFERAGVRWLA